MTAAESISQLSGSVDAMHARIDQADILLDIFRKQLSNQQLDLAVARAALAALRGEQPEPVNTAGEGARAS
jgi:outer membrane protein TolC